MVEYGTEEKKKDAGTDQIDIDRLQGFILQNSYNMDTGRQRKLVYNLNTLERDSLDVNAWLNDIIIDSSMNLLKYYFPDLSGFWLITQFL